MASLFWQFLAWVIGSDGGLIRTGRFCVRYPDGKYTRGLDLGYCGVLRSLFGGRIERAPKPKLPGCYCGGDCGQCGGATDG